jgi:serine/threonine-protein kinase RsbW
MTSSIRLTIRRSEPAPLESGPVAVDLAMASDVKEVETAVELIAEQCFAGMMPRPQTAFRLRVTLAEALSNAILRGNHEDPTKQVWVRAELTAEAIRLSVSDEGSGCELERRAAPCLPADPDQDRGRGLFIIKNLAEQVEFNDRGNTIWMTLPRS